MKTNKLKFAAVAYLLFFVFFTGTLFAQNIMDLSGVFEGTRAQFDSEHQKIEKQFTYKYELKQRDNIVEGVSTIIGEDGNYAEVGIRGVIIKDKLFFEEFKMLDQIKADGVQWCYKFGVLDIVEKDNQIQLYGETPSYMVDYGFACTGGITKLSAIKTQKQENAVSKGIAAVSNLEFDVYPNPTSDVVKFKMYAEKNAKIKIEILDLSGKVQTGSFEKQISKGEYRDSIDVSEFANGLYIFKMTLNNEVFTKEILKF